MYLQWPNGSQKEPTCTSEYGPRERIWTSQGWTRPFHVGVDHVKIGNIKPIAPGTVVDVSWINWAGYQVLIHHGKIDGVNTWTRYCHGAERAPVREGQWVDYTTTILREGETGWVDGKHLHTELYLGGINRGEGSGRGTTADLRTFVRARLKDKVLGKLAGLGKDDKGTPDTQWIMLAINGKASVRRGGTYLLSSDGTATFVSVIVKGPLVTDEQAIKELQKRFKGLGQ